jgi:uncharacterized protein
LDGLDELIQVPRPIGYELRVELIERGVLVTGRLRVTLECECSRCLGPFTMELDLRDWAHHLALDGVDSVGVDKDSVDLTPVMREDILLAFPQHPLCDPGCAGLPMGPAGGSNLSNSTRQTTEVASAWSELNKLKL